MSFKIIVPHVFTEAELTGSTVTLESDWAASTAYSVGDIVVSAIPDGIASQFPNGEYECVAAIDGTTSPQSTTAPADSEAFWVYLGPENRHRAFDVQVGVDQARVIETASTNPDGITIDGKIPTPIQGIALINIDALEGEFKAPTFSGGSDDGEGGIIPSTVTEFDFDFLDRSGVQSSMYYWLTRPLLRQNNKIFLDLNVMANVDFALKLRAQPIFEVDTGKLVRAGAIVMGRVHDIGTTELDASWSLRSRSFKSFDGFKNSLVRRLPGNSVTCEVKVPEGDAEYTRILLEQIDGTAAVFIPLEERPDLSVYGVLTSVQTTARTKEHTFLSLTVESL